MKKLYLFLFAISFCACTSIVRNDQEDSIEENQSISLFSKLSSPYYNLFTTNNPVAISINYHDFSNPNDSAKDILYQKNWGTNNISIDDKNEFVLSCFDTCLLSTSESKTEYFFKNEKMLFINSQRLDQPAPLKIMAKQSVVKVNEIKPIEISKPIFDKCEHIPYCWWDKMEIEWNEDPNNKNGVLIVAVWSGTSLLGKNNYVPPVLIYNVDVVEDTGHAILDNKLFDNIPEWAVMSLLLFRANIVEVIDEKEDLTLPKDPTVNDEQIFNYFNKYVFSNWENIYSVERFARGSVAKMTFILVRDEYRPF